MTCNFTLLLLMWAEKSLASEHLKPGSDNKVAAFRDNSGNRPDQDTGSSVGNQVEVAGCLPCWRMRDWPRRMNMASWDLEDSTD